MKKIGLDVAVVLVACAVGLASFAASAGDPLDVTFDRSNGGVASIVLSSDTNRMNWAKGTGTWGTIRTYSGAIETPDWSDLHRNPPLVYSQPSACW